MCWACARSSLNGLKEAMFDWAGPATRGRVRALWAASRIARGRLHPWIPGILLIFNTTISSQQSVLPIFNTDGLLETKFATFSLVDDGIEGTHTILFCGCKYGLTRVMFVYGCISLKVFRLTGYLF